MLRYIIFVIFGILLFLLLNRKDGFSIGIPYIITNPDSLPLPEGIVDRIFNTPEEAIQAINMNDDLRQLYEDETIDIEEVSCPIPEGVPPDFNVLLHTNIGHLFCDIKRKVGLTFPEFNEQRQQEITKKILNAFSSLIGEHPVKILQQSRLTAQLITADCAAMIRDCLDIDETIVLSLDIFFDLLKVFINILHSPLQQLAHPDITAQLLSETSEEWYIVLSFITQAIYNYPGEIQINERLIRTFNSFQYEVRDDTEGSSTVMIILLNWEGPLNLKNIHMLLWLYLHQQEIIKSFGVPKGYNIFIGISNLKDFYDNNDGPDFCDKSDS